jgi:aldose 1-epimerase
VIQLCNDRLSVCLFPSVGGGIARFDWLGGDEDVPLMRPCLGEPERSPGRYEPNRLACYPLLPWSNRIAHGGFFMGERRVSLPLNRDDDAYPIHGSAWQRRWTVCRHDAEEAHLELIESARDTYSYHASLNYQLDGATLKVRLGVTNTGEDALPFGLGLHPFFPLHGGTTLRAPAKGVWHNDGQGPLPTHHGAIPAPWDFRASLPLPAGGVNHAFSGWTGQAVIEWPRHALRLHIEADVDAYVLYTPGDEDFFCFEPVDHPINAVHLPGGPAANGMTLLGAGETLERHFVFRAEAFEG